VPSSVPENGTNNDWLKAEWSKLCPWGTCGAFTFYLENDDSSTSFYPIQSNYYQFANSPNVNATYPTNNSNFNDYATAKQMRKQQMCQNNLYSESVMTSYVKNYPLDFVQPYFICHKTINAALADAVGNASGTANLVAAVAMLVFGYIFRRVQNQRAKVHYQKMLEGGGKALVVSKVLRDKINDRLVERRNTAMYLLLRELVEAVSEQNGVNAELRASKEGPPKGSTKGLSKGLSKKAEEEGDKARIDRMDALMKTVQVLEEFDMCRSANMQELV
jgi:hypothetical protein